MKRSRHTQKIKEFFSQTTKRKRNQRIPHRQRLRYAKTDRMILVEHSKTKSLAPRSKNAKQKILMGARPNPFLEKRKQRKTAVEGTVLPKESSLALARAAKARRQTSKKVYRVNRAPTSRGFSSRLGFRVLKPSAELKSWTQNRIKRLVTSTSPLSMGKRVSDTFRAACLLPGPQAASSHAEHKERARVLSQTTGGKKTKTKKKENVNKTKQIAKEQHILKNGLQVVNTMEFIAKADPDDEIGNKEQQWHSDIAPSFGLEFKTLLRPMVAIGAISAFSIDVGPGLFGAAAAKPDDWERLNLECGELLLMDSSLVHRAVELPKDAAIRLHFTISTSPNNLETSFVYE